MIAKEKIKLQSNPFDVRTKNVNNDESYKSDENPKKKSVKATPAAYKHESDIYNVRQVERIIELCKKNSVSHIEMPSGLVLDLAVIPFPASDRARKVKRNKTPEARQRAAYARDVMAKKRAEMKAASEASKEETPEDMSYEDIMFYSSTPGGVPIL